MAMILLDTLQSLSPEQRKPEFKGFFAGRGTGIVTVGGQAASKQIVLFERVDGANALNVVRQTWSAPDGSYLIAAIDPDKTYLLMAIDNERRYEPVAWDWLKPAVDED